MASAARGAPGPLRTRCSKPAGWHGAWSRKMEQGGPRKQRAGEWGGEEHACVRACVPAHPSMPQRHAQGGGIARTALGMRTVCAAKGVLGRARGSAFPRRMRTQAPSVHRLSPLTTQWSSSHLLQLLCGPPNPRAAAGQTPQPLEAPHLRAAAASSPLPA